MNTSEPANAPLARRVCVLLIVVAGAMAVGRVLSAQLVYEPGLSEKWPSDPEHPRRGWPATAPRSMPTFGSNDRSRWAAVRALVDEGTWVIGRRDRESGKDSGIIFEDGWQSVDKMLNPDSLEFYSTKPPLLTFLVAGEYWLLKKTFGWSLAEDTPQEGRDQRFAVVRVCLLTFNVLPFIVYLILLARLAEQLGLTDWGRVFVVAAACFGTLVTPFLITLNNHTLAACSVVVAVYAAVRILSSPSPQPSPPEGGEGRVRGWVWFLIAGFFAGFTFTNELPAAAFTAGLGLLLLLRYAARTLLAFIPAALVPVAALGLLNWEVMGNPLDIGYSKFGTIWYEYEGSHWKPRPDQSQRGIDWAKNREGKGAYAFNLLLGHHGWFALTPVFLLGLAGMGLGVRRLMRSRPPHPQPLSPASGERGEGGTPPVPQSVLPAERGEQDTPHAQSPSLTSAESGAFSSPLPPPGGEGLGVREENHQSPPRLWAVLAISTLLLSLIVIAYYIFKSDNYGGWSNGPRWLMWLTPLWLLAMLPVADWLGQRRWGRIVCLILLAASVLSAHYWDWNPWRHPWIYNWMDTRGLIPY